jgi:hypothetical protein
MKIPVKGIFFKSERRGQMEKRISVILALMVVLCLGFSPDAVSGRDGKSGLVPVPSRAGIPGLIADFNSGEENFCEISNDDGNVGFLYEHFDSGMGLAVHLEPDKCSSRPYPFQITDVHFYLFGLFPAEYLWPVDVQVNIRDVSETDKCNGPDLILYSEDFSIPSDSGYPHMLNLTLSQPCCVTGPFFLEVMYQSIQDTTKLPSLLMDLGVATAADTCDNWFLDPEGYHGWVDYWGADPPGDVVLRATGYVNADECNSSWYWKPDTAWAPSGTPDFDQYQFEDSTALCGPAAVANCLWWFDAVPEEYQDDPAGLIRLLAGYFHTHPDSGTDVDSMQSGLNRYFEDYDFSLQENTYLKPDFYEMGDSLKECQNIILLLGFWQLGGVEWRRVGGHFVTLAGTCTDSTKVGLCDPARDAAETGWPGRIRPPDEHPSHPVGDTLHNDPQYVSQDIYWALVESFSAGNWRLVFYQDFEEIAPFEGQNFQPGQDTVSYDSQLPIHTWVEYAIMICPKPTAVEDKGESSLPEDFQLFQNHPNPFNAETQITYHLERPGPVTLSIYNILGEKVVTLVNEYQRAGSKTVTWDGKGQKGKNLASGVYFYELKAGEGVQTKRMVLLK